MKSEFRWLFRVAMIAYIIYEIMWTIGITFSYGENDSSKEVIYILITFVLDVPIIWYMSRNLRIGLILLVTVLTASIALAASLNLVNGYCLALWYAPKLIPITLAILLGRSTHLTRTMKPGSI